jgi:hypothetical protein
MDLTCLPASLHNRPERIPSAVAARIRRAREDGYDRIFVAYADCGTGGLLDRMLATDPAAAGVARLEGAHCYELYAGRAAFAELHDREPGTFYLTDYLVRNFERLVVRGLGLDRHPELLPIYFGNYRRLVYLAQADDAELTARAESAAATLGLAFERRLVGLGELRPALSVFAGAPSDPSRAAPGALANPVMSQAHEQRSFRRRAPDLMSEVHRPGEFMREAHPPGRRTRISPPQMSVAHQRRKAVGPTGRSCPADAQPSAA